MRLEDGDDIYIETFLLTLSASERSMFFKLPKTRYRDMIPGFLEDKLSAERRQVVKQEWEELHNKTANIFEGGVEHQEEWVEFEKTIMPETTTISMSANPW